MGPTISLWIFSGHLSDREFWILLVFVYALSPHVPTEVIGCFPDSVLGSLHSGECTFRVPFSASTPPSPPPLFLVFAQSFPGSQPHISFCGCFPEPTCNVQITEFTHSFPYFLFGKTLSLRVRQLSLRV